MNCLHRSLCMSFILSSYSRANFKSELISNAYELTLVRILSRLPGLIQQCSANLVVHPLASYAHDVASAFNQFYRECPVLQAENPELVQSRLGLVDVSRIVLKNTLDLLGIIAPDRM